MRTVNAAQPLPRMITCRKPWQCHIAHLPCPRFRFLEAFHNRAEGRPKTTFVTNRGLFIGPAGRMTSQKARPANDDE